MRASPLPDNEAVAPDADTSIPDSPPLNIERYRSHLNGLDLSEAQATELLETLWSILSAFVDQAFGLILFYSRDRSTRTARPKRTPLRKKPFQPNSRAFCGHTAVEEALS